MFWTRSFHIYINSLDEKESIYFWVCSSHRAGKGIMKYAQVDYIWICPHGMFHQVVKL